jgi:hypothetical protein
MDGLNAENAGAFFGEGPERWCASPVWLPQRPSGLDQRFPGARIHTHPKISNAANSQKNKKLIFAVL